MIHPNTNIKNVALFDTPKLRESNKIITFLFEAKLLNKFFAKRAETSTDCIVSLCDATNPKLLLQLYIILNVTSENKEKIIYNKSVI